ncbi:HIT domain-containing protein [Candidatus Woesearchaeota archaeon]|nr:HIT domain-containing protein [Candidatus Woesearchaeota archaeon]
MACVFCDSDLSNRLIVESESSFAFPTNIPIVPGHVLVCPRRCVATIEGLSSKEVMDLLSLKGSVADALKRSFGATGFNYAWNEGAVAGQSVPHLHLHVVPRKEGDTGVLTYEPRHFLYRPGSREVSPDAELVSVAQVIRSALYPRV